MYNQGNYQQFGQRLPAVPSPPLPPYQQGPQASQHPITQQGHPSIPPPPYAPLASSVSIPPSGMLSSSQSYLIPPPPPPPHSYSAAPQNSDWNQNQHISPPIPRIPPPPHLQGQQFYRVPVPPRIPLLPPPPTSSYFTPAPFGSFVQPANESSLGHLPPPPPPPPPSSPPPGPPPLPPSSPPPNSPFRSSSKSFTTAPELGPTSRKPSIVDMVASGHDNSIKCTSPNDSATNVKGTSDFNIMSDIPLPPPRPRDEKIVRKIEVLCQYIAKNGHKFEDMTRQKEVDNPEFEFLFGGAPGSEAAISHEYFKWMKKNCSSNELLEGGQNRNISSEPDGSQAGISHSPDVSDMDMEDDITQLEEPDIGKSFGSAKSEPTFISNKVDITVEEHDEHMTHKDATDENLSCPGSSGVIEQGVNLSQDDMQFEKSSMKVGVSNSEWSLDSKAEQQKISLYREMNQSAASDTAEVPAEPIRGTSPFKLIQGYASDDSEPHLEDLSPAPVSPQIKESTTDLDGLHTDIESMPFVEGSLNTASKFPEPSTRTEVVEQAFVDGGTSITDFKQNDRLVDDNVGSKNGGNQKEERKGKMEVDEFGRMVKAGGSDSDSDNYTRRRGKRGRSRSRSRSRSPVGRRRRSPWRRRENRSRSRSWSPKKRSRSRSPYRYGGGAGGDWSRRNKSHLPVCFDFRRGKCFRGESCRYLHDSEKNEESRRHKNKQQYQEVPDRLKTSSKLVSEKDEIDNQEMLIYSDVDKDSQRVKEEFLEPVSPHETLDVDKGLENCSDPLLQNSNDQLPIGAHPLNQTPPVEPQLPLPPLSQGTQLPREYNVMPTSNYSLPPPPPRPQLGGPLPQYQQTQMPPHMNYPFQAFVRPYPFPPEMLTHSVVGESHLGIYPPAALESQRPLSQTEDFRPRTFPMNYPIPQQPGGPMIFGEENFPRVPSPNLISSNSNSQTAVHPPSEGHAYMSRYGLPNPNPIADSISTLVDPGKINPRYPTDFPDGGQLSSMSEFGRSRISTHYNPYASTFDQPLSTKFSSGAFSQPTSIHYLARRSEGDQYDPIFDSIEPSLNSIKKSDKIEGSTKLLDMEENSKHKEVVMTTSTSVENDEFGETADAEVGAVENDSPSSFPIDLTDVATGEIEIDQVKSSGKTKKGKDSRSMKLFKVALADFVKEVLKPSWRQGNMSKEAFKTIVKKTVDKVSGAMKKHQLPKSQAKINQYIDSSQRKLTKLVMGYVDKYVKV